MIDAVPLDADSLVDLDLDGVKLIEASAGTGKTHTIADLYLRQVLAGRLVSQILVVTFTNAATEELRGRIRRRLVEALDCFERDVDGEDRLLNLLLRRRHGLDDAARALQLDRLQFALRAMDEAAISTIHSFCQRALQEHAMSSRQYFEAEMLSGDDEFWESAIKDWWRDRTYRVDARAWRPMRDALPALDKLTRQLLDLRNKPGIALLPAPLDDVEELLDWPRSVATALSKLAPAWKSARRQLVDILSASKDLSRSQTLPYKKGNLEQLIEDADNFFDAKDPDRPFDRFEYLGSQWLYRHSTNTKRGQDPGLRHEFFRAIDPIAKRWEQYGPQLKADALRYAAAKVRDAKREPPALAFQDQLTQLFDALDAPRGDELARRLRRQFPIAMIDEFQDTDDTQFDIFTRVYLDAPETGLTLIGDPKQAIYSFRGGDIFTYMRARRLPAIDKYNLPTNWRSQPRLVAAVNHLFEFREDPFLYSESIAFNPVDSNPDNLRWQPRRNDAALTALTLWRLPLNEAGGNFSRDDMREKINRAVAGEIAALLDGRTMVDSRSLQSGDIAVLVRTAIEGEALGEVLREYGIRSVTISRDSVFSSDESSGLFHLLTAIQQYQDPSLAALSLGSNLLAYDYRQIAQVVDDDARWQAWVDRLAGLRQTWERQGFSALFETLLRDFGLSARLASRDNSERRITNLLHVAELLQQQSASMAGISPLMSWFGEQFDEVPMDEAELRLEGDEALVKIVTIHKSKGLQYPIVFAPFLWSCRQVDKNAAACFHDERLRPRADLGSVDFENHYLLAEKERLAEDLRLLYVALTRARSKIYLAWGPAGDKGKPGYARRTALAYLLHSKQQPADLVVAPVDGFPPDMDFDADLNALADAGEGDIEIVELPAAPNTSRGDKQAAATAPVLAEFSRERLPPWRVNSFTRLTRGVHQPAQSGSTTSRGDAVLDFPAGSHIGLMLHSLLENLDFRRPLGEQSGELFDRFLPAAGLFDEAYRATLLDWLENILATELDADGLSLNCLDNSQRLDELEFDFALDQIDFGALNALLQSISQHPLQALEAPAFEGLITGFIDLVFEYRGRYYLADYKSNLLGASLDDYDPQRLELAMLHRRYDLQLLLYAFALHRYLGRRLPDYDYEKHFGGGYYLFLRAMRPETGNRRGVYFRRPDLETLGALETLFRYTPARAEEA